MKMKFTIKDIITEDQAPLVGGIGLFVIIPIALFMIFLNLWSDLQDESELTRITGKIQHLERHVAGGGVRGRKIHQIWLDVKTKSRIVGIKFDRFPNRLESVSKGNHIQALVYFKEPPEDSITSVDYASRGYMYELRRGDDVLFTYEDVVMDGNKKRRKVLIIGFAILVLGILMVWLGIRYDKEDIDEEEESIHQSTDGSQSVNHDKNTKDPINQNAHWKNRNIRQCLKCKSNHIIPFEFGHSDTLFALNEKPKLFGLIPPHMLIKSHPTICLDCGHFRAEVNTKSLKNKAIKFQAKMTRHECLRCRKTHVYSGKLIYMDSRMGHRPARLSIPDAKFTLSDDAYPGIDDHSWACPDCGLTWSTLSGSVRDLHRQIKKWSKNQSF